MNGLIFISYAHEDRSLANDYAHGLQASGYSVFMDSVSIRGGKKWEQELKTAVKSALAVVNLVSPDSAASDWVLQECTWARQYKRFLIPVLIRFVPELPWYVEDLQVIDATINSEKALEELILSLPEPIAGISFGRGRDNYLNRATLKSAHTMDAYRQAIALFFTFLEDRDRAIHNALLPIQQSQFTIAEELPLEALTEEDAPIFLHFAQWLMSPSSGKKGDRRPYKPSTVELRVAGVQSWFQFLDDYGWLPGDFKLAKAKRIVADEIRSRPQKSGPPQPPEYIEEVIYYYDTQPLPKHLRKPDVDQERVQRWELTRLRNRALLHTLAETGGRISEVLSLNLADFPPRHLETNDVLRIEVLGKGGHTYYLRVYDSLPAIRAYIKARGANLKGLRHGDVPLFVSHDPHYDGNRMSRVVAWRVVQRASKALGLQSITPHDFRHWRATQLLNAGHSLDVVQEYLGHRSVETTRSYYAHTDPLQVDSAAKETRLPDPDDIA